MAANAPLSMNERICSVRVRSWASISGTVSGMGTGIKAGSTDDERSGAGVGGVAAGVEVAGDVAGIAAVVVADGATFGSFEKASKLKSKRVSRSPGLKATFAYIFAGNGCLPIGAWRYRPLRTSGISLSFPVVGSLTTSVPEISRASFNVRGFV